MPSDLVIPLGGLYAFLLVFVRVAGVFTFLPIPGVTAGPAAARVVLALAFTLALAPRWPAIDPGGVILSTLIAWIIAEAALGLAAGILVGMMAEVVVMGTQILGFQAGYGYASTIDPNTQADSGILLVLAQLFAGLLFFAFGWDRQVILIFANSLQSHPPGTWTPSVSMAEEIIRAGSSIFSVGLRLAMPVAGMLLLVDLTLALVGRINAQVQMITIAFPLKMVLALLMLSWTLVAYPQMYEQQAVRLLTLMSKLIAH